MQKLSAFMRRIAITLPAVLGLALAFPAQASSTSAPTIQPALEPVLAAPVFKPVAGTYTTAQSVTIMDATSTAGIYYTTDGTTPTAKSKKFSNPIPLPLAQFPYTTTIKAIAIATGYQNSTVATAAYTISAATANLAFTASDSNPVQGQSITLKATLTITGKPGGPAIGKYYIYDGATALVPGAMANFVDGFAYQTSSLGVGTHKLSAKYVGLANGLTAVSPTIVVTVTAAPSKPTITGLSPSSAIAGGEGFFLTIKGTNFTPTATVMWGATQLKATYFSATRLTALVASGLIGPAGSASVTVTTAVGTSAEVTFEIFPPRPEISSLSPSSAAAGGAAFTLTINGKNFTSTASARWGSTLLAPKFVNAGQLTAPIAASLIANPGTASVTVTTTGGTSTGVAFTITPPAPASCSNDGSGNGKLKGNYAFQLSQTYLGHGGGLGFLVGAFTADGSGKFTGVSDSNYPGNTKGEVNSVLGGTYSIGPDDRGTITVNIPQSSGPSMTSSYCFALDSIANGVAGGGRIVEDDATGNISSGAFYAQGGSNFTPEFAKGSWVFGLQGATNYGNGLLARIAAAGYLTLDGAGGVSTGETDISMDLFTAASYSPINEFVHQTGLTGSYTLSSNGRGTLTFSAPSTEGGTTSRNVFYVAGPNRVLLMNTDANGSPVMAGEGLLRTTTTFSNASLKGTSVFVENAVSNSNSMQYDQRKVAAGIVNWGGNGTYTDSFDQNDAGTVTLASKNTFSGSYAVDANGRATTGAEGPNRYLIGPNWGFGVVGNLGAALTYFEKQTVPAGGFKPASFDGNYAAGTLWYGFEKEQAVSGVWAANGAGALTKTLDWNTAGKIALDQTINETYTAAASGRFVEMDGAAPDGAIYLVSPDKAYKIDLSGSAWNPLVEINRQ